MSLASAREAELIARAKARASMLNSLQDQQAAQSENTIAGPQPDENDRRAHGQEPGSGALVAATGSRVQNEVVSDSRRTLDVNQRCLDGNKECPQDVDVNLGLESGRERRQGAMEISHSRDFTGREATEMGCTSAAHMEGAQGQDLDMAGEDGAHRSEGGDPGMDMVVECEWDGDLSDCVQDSGEFICE